MFILSFFLRFYHFNWIFVVTSFSQNHLKAIEIPWLTPESLRQMLDKLNTMTFSKVKLVAIDVIDTEDFASKAAVNKIHNKFFKLLRNCKNMVID